MAEDITLCLYTDLQCALWDCERRRAHGSFYCSDYHETVAHAEEAHPFPRCLGSRFNLNRFTNVVLEKLLGRMVAGVTTGIPLVVNIDVLGTYPWDLLVHFRRDNLDERERSRSWAFMSTRDVPEEIWTPRYVRESDKPRQLFRPNDPDQIKLNTWKLYRYVISGRPNICLFFLIYTPCPNDNPPQLQNQQDDNDDDQQDHMDNDMQADMDNNLQADMEDDEMDVECTDDEIDLEGTDDETDIESTDDETDATDSYEVVFHTGHLVVSALSDPYLWFAAEVANQEVLLWIKSVVEECGENISKEQLKEYVRKTLNSGKDRLKKLKSEHGKVQLGNITVDMVIDGMRGMTELLWETSLLDPEEGIRFRGLSIPELQKVLPAAQSGGEPLPEGLLWLLLTGKVPSKEQVETLSKDWASRAAVPDYVYTAIDALPSTAHPMTQFASGVMALQVQSAFQKAYENGIHKPVFWEPTYEDCLNLIVCVPVVAAYVYRRMYKNGDSIPSDKSLDYGAKFSRMLGFDDETMKELMRVYISIHSDHEGGNVSAHTGHVVGSALSDPYLSALNGLAGPLQGLANQEVLLWIKSVVEGYVRKTLNSGQVVPGYGHGVLRKTDPRCVCRREFALKHLPDDPLFQVSKLNEVVPSVLTEFGKVQESLAPPSVDLNSSWKACKSDHTHSNSSQIQFFQDLRTRMVDAEKSFERQDPWYAPDSTSLHGKTVAETVGDWYFDPTAVKTCYNLISK